MKQTCYRLKKEDYLAVIPCADLATQLTVGEADYWQDIETATPDELASWIRSMGLHPLMVEDILEPKHSTLIDRYREAVYIEFPTNPDNSDVGVGYLSIILTPHLIATIRRGRVPGMPALVERFQNEIRPPVERTIAVVYHILDHFIDRNMQLSLKLRLRISSLEKAFVDDLTAIEVSAVTGLRQETSAQISIVEDQLYCVKTLEDMHLPVLDFNEYKPYIRDLVSGAKQVLRVLRRSEERLDSLYGSYQLATNDASEKRLRLLTIISAVFLPLTLITGFFGMNFSGMILLNKSYGFGLAVSMMIAIFLLMLGYFYRQGWFE